MNERKNRKSVDVTKPVERPRIPVAVLFRMFVLGTLAVVAAGYAIYRHYFVPRPSMLEPVPPATELPAPEIVPLPPASP